ncbi:hypothetical protein [Rhizobium leguminosarum]|uniref:hypothetical protein n=1 Tax=Rhizobium leguminosarum TaxID=384 RepID=UPI0003FE937E|nr:hypothetical protein [Rhizobium leguminosarum]
MERRTFLKGRFSRLSIASAGLITRHAEADKAFGRLTPMEAAHNRRKLNTYKQESY